MYDVIIYVLKTSTMSPYKRCSLCRTAWRNHSRRTLSLVSFELAWLFTVARNEPYASVWFMAALCCK